MNIQNIANQAKYEALRHPTLTIAEVITRYSAYQAIDECIREIKALPHSAVIDPDILKEKICARLVQIAASVRLP